MPAANEQVSLLPNDRMRALVDQLNEAGRAYYEQDNPFLSDAQYDKLYDELVLLEKQTGVQLPDSPTHRVGGQPLAAFLQHRHITRLWSMDKVQDEAGLADWLQRVEKQAVKAGFDPKGIVYYVEYKLDGLKVNLTYDGGQLVQAATRGNGEVGEAILPQARTVRSIPLSIPFKGKLEVQGECIMRLSVLEKYNRTAAEPLKNARNAAAGALRNLDPRVTAERKLDAFFYLVGTISVPRGTGAGDNDGAFFDDQAGMIAFLQENGFPVCPYIKQARNFEELQACIREIEESRPNLDFLIDGAVVKAGDFALRRALGYTDKFPIWEVAYKFEAEENVTTLLNVVWEPGRTGKLTPLAHLEPVDFGGVTVKRATLNNWGDIQRKRVAIGCEVWLRRSNDVIPEIMGRVGEPGENETEIKKPDRCPACGGPVIERGAHLYCMNRETCRPQAVARLAHFAGRDAMDIETFSEKTAGLFYDTFGVRDPAGLYGITREQLLSLEGFKEKKADNLLKALEDSRHCALDAFLFALGIPNVGRKTARDLANHFGALDKLKGAPFEELTAIPEVGDVVAQSIIDFFSFPENIDMIQRLLEAGVAPREAKKSEGGALNGLTVVVTGTLPSLSRTEAEDLIRNNGGIASGSVSRKTSFVLCGENAGSKLDKARELGIPVIDEEEFMRRIES